MIIRSTSGETSGFSSAGRAGGHPIEHGIEDDSYVRPLIAFDKNAVKSLIAEANTPDQPNQKKHGPYKRSSGGGLFSESMVIMGLISRAIDKLIDKLPKWTKLIGAVFVVFGIVYYIAHYGFFSFLLRTMFSPVP